MNVAIAIDSLKGSLSSMEAADAIKEGILKAHPSANVSTYPLADGGEGTVDAIIEGLGAKKISLTVTGPLNSSIEAYYGFIKASKTAIIEMASAAGITLLSPKELNPYLTTTFGVGEMILDAVKKGAKTFIIGIGGSATNDGGTGMLKALGYSFLDENEKPIREGCQDLEKIKSIIPPSDLSFLFDITFHIACDVKNPLLGEQGATYVFGPQKGLVFDHLEAVDSAMAHYAHVASNLCGTDYSTFPGAGAAGGLGFAFKTFLHANLTPGVDLILDLIHFDAALEDVDIVVTGEGRLDRQTSMGKAPIGVAKMAQKKGIKVLAFAGGVTEDAIACNAAGITAFFPILRTITTLEKAMEKEQARTNMIATVEQVFRLL